MKRKMINLTTLRSIKISLKRKEEQYHELKEWKGTITWFESRKRNNLTILESANEWLDEFEEEDGAFWWWGRGIMKNFTILRRNRSNFKRKLNNLKRKWSYLTNFERKMIGLMTLRTKDWLNWWFSWGKWSIY